MSKRLSAKYKVDRRYGVNLWGRPKSASNLRNYAPGQHGLKNKPKLSDFGLQLAAKQKLRFYYGGIGERQFRRFYKEAQRLSGDTGENLVGLLERRLDAAVYRMKLVPTIFSARQVVNHGHILVNGKRVNIPSYLVKVGDVVSLKPASREISLMVDAMGSGERDIPDYIQVDAKNFQGTFSRIPAFSDVPYAAQMEPNLIVEWYSRRI